MPVLVGLVFGLFCLAVVGTLAVYGDRTMRVIVAIAVLFGLAVVAFMEYAARTEQPITNGPTTLTR